MLLNEEYKAKYCTMCGSQWCPADEEAITKCMKTRFEAPGPHCGSCPIWLAAFDHSSLQTMEQVVATCKKSNCPTLAQEEKKMKKIYVCATILATMEFDEDDDDEYIDTVVRERLHDAVTIEEGFCFNDVEWSYA